MKRQLVIFCESYGEIPYVLQLAQSENSEIYLVIIGFPDLFQFFKIINEKVFRNSLKIIHIEYFKPGRVNVKGLKKLLYVFPDIVREKQYLQGVYKQYFARLAGFEIYFVSRAFNGMKAYLFSKNLSKNNTLFYVYINQNQMKQTLPVNFVELANMIIWKLTYGCMVSVGKTDYYRGFLYLSDGFLKKKVSQVIRVEDILKDFIFDSFRIFHEADKYSVIFFDADLIGAGYIMDENLYRKELSDIYDITYKHFPGEIATKHHPGQESGRMIEFGDSLPKFIPAEFLYNNHIKVNISVISKAIAHLEKGVAISLLELVTLKNENIREVLKNSLLEKSKSEIFFPKTLEELNSLLASVVQ